MQIRKLEMDRDYETVCQWWKGYKWPIIPKGLLPKTGFIIDDLAACWVLRTDSPIVILEPLVGNPNADAQLRREAVSALFEAVVKYSKEIGAEHIFAISKHRKLAQRGSLHGFSEILTGQSLFYKGVS